MKHCTHAIHLHLPAGLNDTEIQGWPWLVSLLQSSPICTTRTERSKCSKKRIDESKPPQANASLNTVLSEVKIASSSSSSMLYTVLTCWLLSPGLRKTAHVQRFHTQDINLNMKYLVICTGTDYSQEAPETGCQPKGTSNFRTK